MNVSLNEPVLNCLQCGVPLGTDARQGLCARCLFSLAASAAGVERAMSGDGAEVPAAIAEGSAAEGNRAGRRLGDYELFEEVGRGGMGIVYRARQISLRRWVAVKLLRFGPLAGDEFVKRLRMEAIAAGCLRHPSIVAIHEVSLHEDQHFLVMDYVAGPNLARLAGNQPLGACRSAQITKNIAEAIEYAHGRGILHRDLKPSNILIEGEDQPRITDFGLAKRVDSGAAASEHGLADTLTLTGQVLGSPNFMPPEQVSAAKHKVGRYSDVYAIGAILYQLLTGRPPFLGENISAVLHQVMEAEPVPPRLLNPEVPIDLETICLRCLEKDPDRRYATAAELAEELGRYLHGDPIHARPVSGPQRLWRWCRKNSITAGLIAATLALLVTVAIGSPIAAYRIYLARQETENEKQRALKSEAAALRQLYAMNMNLAQAAWDANHFVRLQELLDAGRAFPDRGFEWFFWRRQAHLALTRLRGHLGTVLSAACSPDGHWFATGSEDQTAMVWKRSGGSEPLVLRGHAGRVRSVAWFPDSQRLVTGSDDHTVKIWEARSGKEIVALAPRRGRVSSVAVSRDGQWIAAANQDGTASVWAFTGGPEVRVLEGHTAEVWSVAFSPDGQLLATGSADQTARIWEWRGGRALVTLNGHASDVRSAKFSPEGERLVTAAEDELAIVWQVSDGRRLTTLKGHPHFVQAAVFSPDGQRIATASNDRSAKLWDAADGRELLSLNAHDHEVYCVDFSPDGQTLVTGARDAIVRLWDLSHQLNHLHLQAHPAPIQSVRFSRDTRLLAVAGADGLVLLLEARTGGELHRLPGHQGKVAAAVFSPNGERLATAGDDGTAKIWETATGRLLRDWREFTAPVSSIDFSPDGHRIATGTGDGRIQVWNTESGQLELAWDGHANVVHDLTFSNGGQRMASASLDETAKIWDAATGREILTLKGHADSVLSISFSPDGNQIVTGSVDQTAKIWDAETGREVLTFRAHAGKVTSVAYLPDGQRILSGSDDRTAKLWDAGTGLQFMTFPSSPAPILSVARAEDGLRLAISNTEGRVAVWEAVSAGQVALWEQQEEQARLQVEHLRQERLQLARQQSAARARDPGALREWLILAPIPFRPGQSGRDSLDEPFGLAEEQLQPAAGQRARFGESELVWRKMQFELDAVDFAQLSGRLNERCVAYAAAYIESETEQTGVRLLVGSDDLSKTFLNGQPVHRSPFQRGYRPDEDVVEGLRLKAGTNVLVFKIVNINFDWKGSVRLTDAQGNPLQGIHVRLP